MSSYSVPYSRYIRASPIDPGEFNHEKYLTVSLLSEKFSPKSLWPIDYGYPLGTTKPSVISRSFVVNRDSRFETLDSSVPNGDNRNNSDFMKMFSSQEVCFDNFANRFFY